MVFNLQTRTTDAIKYGQADIEMRNEKTNNGKKHSLQNIQFNTITTIYSL